MLRDCKVTEGAMIPMAAVFGSAPQCMCTGERLKVQQATCCFLALQSQLSYTEGFSFFFNLIKMSLNFTGYLFDRK